MKRRRLRWILFGYVVLTIFLTFPLVVQLTDLMLDAGAGEDAYIFVWNIWWLKQALFELRTNPYITDFIFYPDGTNLALHTFPIPASFLGAVFSFILPGVEGLFVGYNLVILVSFITSALGMYLLVLRLTGSRSAAFVSGIVFAFSHYRFSNTVRLHCLETGILAFCVWALVGMVQEKRMWWGCLVGVLSSALLYSSKEYFVHLLMGIGLALIYFTLRSPSRIWNRRMLPPKLAAAVLFIILSLPLLLAVQSHGFGGGAQATPHAEIFSADLFDPLVPNPRHPLFGPGTVAVERKLHGGESGFGLSLSLVALGLAVWALMTGQRTRVWPWAGLGLVFFLFAMGPIVHVAGRHTGIPSLYRGLSAVIPWLDFSRTPMRAIVPVQLALAVLVGFALAPTPDTSPHRLRITILVMVLILFETLSMPFPMTEVAVHSHYRQLARHPGDAAVLELPPKDRSALLHQTVHGKKILATRRAYPRAPRWSLSFWTSDAFRGLLETLFRQDKILNLSEESLSALAAKHRHFLTGHGIHFVTITKDEIPEREREQALRVLGAMRPESVFEDETLAAFEFQAQIAQIHKP